MNVIGLMSGTSLDGLDIALCQFDDKAARPYRILAAQTVPYPRQWVDTLSNLEHASAYDYALADVRLGHYFGEQVRLFLQHHPGIEVDLIASHGHTIFHQPFLGLTTQIGCGDAIAAETGLPVVCNFRRYDVAAGGQGAPLVPIGDRLLFADYQACLNLGGFCNISYDSGADRLAFDIAPCNMALNLLARRLGQQFDRDGQLAATAKVDPELLAQLNALPYYAQPAPKSLGKEWFVKEFLPLLAESADTAMLLRTVVEHVAGQIAQVVEHAGIRTLMVTGGGARNAFLVSRIRSLCPQTQVSVPDSLVVDYKEALIFAYLGYLRVNGKTNCLATVTGAPADSSTGQICGPIKQLNLK